MDTVIVDSVRAFNRWSVVWRHEHTLAASGCEDRQSCSLSGLDGKPRSLVLDDLSAAGLCSLLFLKGPA